MRVLRISTILCFLAVALAFCAGQAYTRFFLDETAPVNSVDQATVQTSVEDPQSTLLDHVSAYDDRDGDLSGEVMLGGISKLISDNTAKPPSMSLTTPAIWRPPPAMCSIPITTSLPLSWARPSPSGSAAISP